MIVSISESGEPAKIDFRMLSTDSLEKRPDSSRVGSTLGRISVGDCLTVSINLPFLCHSIKGGRPTPLGSVHYVYVGPGDNEDLASARDRIRVLSERMQGVATRRFRCFPCTRSLTTFVFNSRSPSALGGRVLPPIVCRLHLRLLSDSQLRPFIFKAVLPVQISVHSGSAGAGFSWVGFSRGQHQLRARLIFMWRTPFMATLARQPRSSI